METIQSLLHVFETAVVVDQDHQLVRLADLGDVLGWHQRCIQNQQHFSPIPEFQRVVVSREDGVGADRNASDAMEKFLVDRILGVFVGGLVFFVGGLALFVGGLVLFVGGLILFVGGLVLFVGWRVAAVCGEEMGNVAGALLAQREEGRFEGL